MNLHTLENAVLDKLSQGHINSALELIQNFVQIVISDPNSVPTVFGSETLDRLCLSVGKSFEDIRQQLKPIDGISNQIGECVVTIATQIANFGGHTRVIEDIINALPEKKHVILLTDLFNIASSVDIACWLSPIPKLIIAPRGNALEKLIWLARQLDSIKPTQIFLFNHHQDAVAIASVQPWLKTNKVFFCHHGDHHLCLGVHLPDVIHIDLTNTVYHDCRMHAGLIENCYLPLVVEDRGPRRVNFNFLRDDLLRTCSSGSFNKFTTPYLYRYIDLISRRLVLRGGVHIHIGHLTGDMHGSMLSHLASEGIDVCRFVHIPWVKSLWSALLDNEIDLYICSFPVGGGKASIEAMGSGTPLLLHQSNISKYNGGLDLAYPTAFAWKNSLEFCDLISNVTSKDLTEHSANARRHFESYHLPELMALQLNNILSGNEHLEPPPLRFYETDDSQKYLYSRDVAFESFSNDRLATVRVLAFFLPQFYEIPENNEWWGDGFTEWTNVRQGKPLFKNHHQPLVPSELGYYDLSNIDVLAQQAKLAKEHGIYGFCFCYYWFDGKRLLEKPVDQLIQSTDIDLPFCLCWANENWTRRWDGGEQDVLIHQSYSPALHEHFASDLVPYFSDSRYIKIDGRPVFLVHRTDIIPDLENTITEWRRTWRSLGLGEVYLVAIESFDLINPNEFGFDASAEFPMHQVHAESLSPDENICSITDKNANIGDYRKLVKAWLSRRRPSYKCFHGLLPGWDNSARRPKGGATLFVNANPTDYETWLTQAVTRTFNEFQGEERLVFINAWNEWGEGCILEPDLRWGRGYLDATKRVMSRIEADLLAQLTAPEKPEVVFSYASLLQSARLELAHPLVKQLIAKRHTIHISVVVLSGGNQNQLDKTLASISQQIRSADTVEIIPAGRRPELQPMGDIAQWTLVLCDGDILESDTLLLLEKALQRCCTEDTLLLYFDHDEINEHGQYDCPHLKPDFNHDLLLSYPYIGRAVLVRTIWLARCLSSAATPLASLPLAYWLALRAVAEVGAKAFLHLPAVLAHMAAAEPAVFASTTKQWQELAGILAGHLGAVAPGAQILEGPGPGTFKVVYPLVEAPLVTIVIPTRDQVALLSRCIVSIFQNTNYPNFEVVVVDNDSQTPDALEFLSGLGQIASGRVRVLRAPGKFNFSRMNNLAAQQANGEFLLLLNNDTAAVQPDWLSHMVRNALRDNVGVVGARLLYPDDTLQHAGVIMGLRGPADHPCIGIPADGAGYLYRAQVQQDFSAVTAACLLVRKSLYLKLGGLDETSFAVSYNDVDFCLRVGQAGQRVVWTPLASLLHEGSASQKSNVEGTSESNKLARFATERAAMYARWPVQIANDPAFNPNLSRRKLGYELEESNPLLRFDKLQGLTAHRVLALPSDADGCGQYRVLQPMQAMLEAGLCTGGCSREVFAPNLLLRSGADTLVVQRVDNDFGLDFLESVRALKGVKKIYEVDDHPSKVRLTNEAHKLLPKDMRGRVAKAIGLCDRLVVSTPPLARALANYNSDIRVVPNRLPPAMWGGTPPQKRLIQDVAKRKPKVGWAGGIGHAADLKMIEAVIKEFSDRVDWVFIGAVPDSIRKYLKGYLSGVPTLKYPGLMMAQDWDLAIAPLELHEFNECKSNLKLLEYGWCGIPVVCSDITPYQCGLQVTRVKNRFKDWRNAIAERIADLEACHRDGLVLQQQIAADWTLQGEHVMNWYKAWTD